jgi:arsenite methyltransferase
LRLFSNLSVSLVEARNPGNELTNMNTTIKTLEQDQARRQVRARYGEIARSSGRGCGCGPSCGDDGAGGTNALTLGYSATDLQSVPNGAEMGLGCGNPTAHASIQPGETILDLGSGGGFDCFLAAQRTGPAGRVIGVDMTPDMISKARANSARSGLANVEFRLGEIENLPVADGTVDLILSNCVINLSPDKPRVYAEAFRALKPGGRLAVSDIVALQPIPEALKDDFAAYTGCVAGAASVAEIEAMLAEAGFTEVRVAVKETSRAFINDWLPGKRPGDYVASAGITARKPAAACCEESCCGSAKQGGLTRGEQVS